MTETLCDECRAIDFDKLTKFSQDQVANTAPFDSLGSYGTGSYGTDDKIAVADLLLDMNANRFDSPTAEDCALCRVLSASLCPCEDEWSDPGVVEFASQAPYVLEAFSFRRNCPWVPKSVERIQDCHMLLAKRGAFNTSGNYSKFVRGDGYVVCLPKGQEKRFYVPQVVPDTFDAAKAKLWLENCIESHGGGCNEVSLIVSGMRVIDCETLMVVDAQDGMEWVALSYVWGQAKPRPTSQNSLQGGGPLNELSKTVVDAIQVTKSLGYKYLWIDRYCIDQDNTAAKQSQLRRMDAIYRGAELTIIAAAGQDENYGLPGVGGTRRKKQQALELPTCTILSTGPDPIHEARKSRWWSRGWTFQEGLMSRRRLVFTEHQSFFECGGGCCMEALGGFELLDIPKKLTNTSEPVKALNSAFLCRARLRMANLLSAETAGFDQFLTIVSEYTKRILTFDSDSLVAFAGVAHHLQQVEPKVSHILGIPYMPSVLASGRDDGYIVYSLCWFHKGDSVPRRRPQFPSWTWAGWAGQVHWMSGLLTGTGKDVIQKLRNVQIEDNESISALEEYLRVYDFSNTTTTESKLALRFDAQVVPFTFFKLVEREDGTISNSSDKDDAMDAQESDATLPVQAGSLDGQEDPGKKLPLQELHVQENDGKEEEIRTSSKTNVTSATDSDEHPPRDNDTDSTPESLDPHDWENWLVGKHGLWDRSRTPKWDPLEFVQNLESGRWSCLLLADYDGNAGFSHRRFLLVVEWLQDGSAHRIGSLVLNQHRYLDADEPQFFEDEDLEWVGVRLV